MNRVLNVTELNELIKDLLESDNVLNGITIIAEISDFKLHQQSGHVYFTLKDSMSMIRATMWKTVNGKLLNLKPVDGMKIKATGNISYYAKGGTVSFNVTDVSLDGDGEAKRKYEELKLKYDQLGYFDEVNKKKIPKYPKNIAIITAPEGDAVKDMITSIWKNAKFANIFVFPALVQGSGSAESIAKQIKKANSFSEKIDTIILGRGGGSYEHLASFNEPIVVEAIYNSTVPIITGIGHDKDVTIACYVSDLNVSTPTAAGLAAVSNLETVIDSINNFKERLGLSLRHKLNDTSNKINMIKLEIKNSLQDKFKVFNNVFKMSKVDLNNSLVNLWNHTIMNFENNRRLIDAHNINNNLKKGYSILSINNNIIKSVQQVNINDEIKARLDDGELKLIVKDRSEEN